MLIIGTGHYGRVGLSEAAEKYFNKHGCQVELMVTPKAIHAWNSAGEKVIGLFHVTC